MSYTMIRGRYVIRTGGTQHSEPEVLEDTAVLIRNGAIVEIGPYRELVERDGIDAVVGDGNAVVSPGFVNSHHHLGLTPLQLGSPDLPLELWINHRIGGKNVDVYLDTLYSAFEMIRSGVTTVQHLHGRVPGPIENIHAAANEVLRAYRDIGMRASYSFGIRDQNTIAHCSDKDLIASLPEALGSQLAAFLGPHDVPVDDHLQLYQQLAVDNALDSRVAIQLAPLNLNWCSDATLEAIAAYAEANDVPLHMHLVETPYEHTYAYRHGAESAVSQIAKRGLLGPRLTLGHGVWMSDADLDLIGETGTRICHNCSSNMRLRSGKARVKAMHERGIEVSIGIDEAGLNDDRDMLQELRLVLNSHREPGIGVEPLTPLDVFTMATVHGARTTGYGDAIGRLDVGQRADIVLYDWRELSYPYLHPDVPVLHAVVQRAKPRAVKTVMIDGEVVYDDGAFTRVNEAEVLDALATSLAAELTPEELALREMGKQLVPHLETFYQDYDIPK